MDGPPFACRPSGKQQPRRQSPWWSLWPAPVLRKPYPLWPPPFANRLPSPDLSQRPLQVKKGPYVFGMSRGNVNVFTCEKEWNLHRQTKYICQLLLWPSGSGNVWLAQGDYDAGCRYDQAGLFRSSHVCFPSVCLTGISTGGRPAPDAASPPMQHRILRLPKRPLENLPPKRGNDSHPSHRRLLSLLKQRESGEGGSVQNDA